MGRQKNPRRVKVESDFDGMKAMTPQRITRSHSRKIKAEQVEIKHKSPSSDVKGDVATAARSETFQSTLVGYPEIFFDRVVPFLCTSSLTHLCEALEPHPVARELLRDGQQWRYIAQREESLRGGGGIGEGAWHLVIRTVNIPGACPELIEYLSVRSQRESIDENVIVTAGDLEFITEINGVKVDCLAFPTSPAYYNPHIGVAGCVHRRAGHVRSQRAPLPIPLTTPGFGAGVNLLIHSTGSAGMYPNRQRLLYESYERALRTAHREEDVKCAAFASISTGTLGYPVDEAAPITMAAVLDTMGSLHWPKNKKIAFVCVDKHVLQAFTAARDETLRTLPFTRLMFADVLAGSLV